MRAVEHSPRSTYLEGSNTLRALYDPTNEYASLDDATFFATVADYRRTIQYESDSGNLSLPGFGDLTPHEGMALEASHALVPVPEALVDSLDTERMKHLNAFDAQRSAKAISHVGKLATSQELRHIRRQNYLGLRISRVDSADGRLDSMLLSARVLAHLAHYGVSRRNGDPYITHPESVASIVDVGWSLALKSDESREVIRTHKAASYLHDAFEDTITNDGAYLTRDIIPSPRIIRDLLSRHDFNESTQVAKAVRLMTHNEGALPGVEKMPYSDYIHRGVAQGGALFAVPKAADIQHNSRIDIDKAARGLNPVGSELLRRRAKYESSRGELLRAADSFPIIDTTFVLHSIFMVNQSDMQQVYRNLSAVDVCAEDLKLS